MRFAYDLDGVLAVGPPAEMFGTKKWRFKTGPERAAHQQGLLAWYAQAEPLLVPTAPFWVITARRDQLARESTERWLRERYGDLCLGVRMLGCSRTLENVIAFKAQALRELPVDAFAEDNRRVLRGVRRANTGRALFWFGPEGLVPFT